jgi:predicted ATP-binding protein involved in virulence
MECCKMKILELKITKLHDYIDYNIMFNKDVTFLYGDNGCGKTTVLNIITSIITGRVYELFKFRFNSIALKYIEQHSNTPKKIIIHKNNENSTLIINYNQKDYAIELQRIRIMEERIEDEIEIEHLYLSEYSVLSEIKKEFSYIYLPLNRNGSINDNVSIYMRKNLHRLYTRASAYSDLTINDVTTLIRESYNRINFTLSKINENFSEELLKSFLDIENITNAKQLLIYANKLNPDDISKIQNDYTVVLKTIKKWDDSTNEKITIFFESLLNDIKKSKNENGLNIEILFKLSELIKINSVIEKAERLEQSKSKVTQPLSNFLNAVNKFIKGKNNKKEICIDKEGQLFLKTSHKPKIDLQLLSSGEKQIVTFFAYLVFGLNNTNQSLFIVDEPELSLHLEWQLEFVDTLLELNPDIQLIFATHSPEIIGKRRDKAFKLIPNY